jgi:hypothetical protein
VVGYDFNKAHDREDFMVIDSPPQYMGIYIMVEPVDNNRIDYNRQVAIDFGQDYIAQQMSEAQREYVYAVILHREHWIIELKDKQGYVLNLNDQLKQSAQISDLTAHIDLLLDKSIQYANPEDEESDTDKYIVAWMMKREGPYDDLIGPADTDQYQPFIEEVDGLLPKAQAQDFYNNLLEDPRLYTANLCKIIASTDYF